jgi:uncharacterized OsmC-like protein
MLAVQHTTDCFQRVSPLKRSPEEPSTGQGFAWTARVRWVGEDQSVVYARTNSFVVGRPASFRQTDEHPSAVEYLLGALGADITGGFQIVAEQRSIQIDDMEMRLSGRLGNALVHIGVIGEEGDPGFAEITGTLYVRANADESALREVWQTTLARSPVFNTLKKSVQLKLDMRLVD